MWSKSYFATASMKRFNTAGTCRPNDHYMVDITERLEIIRGMVTKGDYFCINKNKKSGLQPPVELNGRTLIEAIV